MRGFRTLCLCLCVAGCGHSGPSAPPGVGVVCSSPTLTKLDLLVGQPGGPGWVDGTLVAAHFADPWTLTGDGAGHLYVADGMTIRAIDVTSAMVTTLAGAYARVGDTDGVGAQATFNSPSGLAFTNGQLYLTDTENHTIRKIDVQSGTVTTVAGASGQPGAVDAVGADARFREPEGLALDSNGNLYVGDTDNNTIRMVALGTGTVTTVAGSAGQAGTADGVGSAALFNKPKAVALDAAGHLFVLDSLNQSIRSVELATGTVSTRTTFGSPTQGPVPQGVTVDGADALVSLVGGAVADNGVVRVAADGTVTPFAGGMGTPGFVDGVGAGARFSGPAGLWNDGAGTVYVADNGNYVVRAIDTTTAAVTTYAGADSTGSANGIGVAARFDSPQGLAADDHTAYVADTKNDTIRRLTLATGEVTAIAGGTGKPDIVDGAVGDARFNQPQGLALDSLNQKLYVADTGNRRIRLIDLTAGIVTTLTFAAAPGETFGGFNAPSGLALDRDHLFVTDYSDDRVLAIDLAKGQISTLAGTAGIAGRADGAGSGAAFYGPLGVAADGRGNLYVADDLNETVRKIIIATGTVSTLAGQPATPGYGDGVGPAARFHYPFGVAADCAGDVFVSDTFNSVVRRIDASTGAVTTVIGVGGAAGVRAGALPAQISQPYALALTPSGQLLVVSENAVLLAH